MKVVVTYHDLFNDSPFAGAGPYSFEPEVPVLCDLELLPPWLQNVPSSNPFFSVENAPEKQVEDPLPKLDETSDDAVRKERLIAEIKSLGGNGKRSMSLATLEAMLDDLLAK